METLNVLFEGYEANAVNMSKDPNAQQIVIHPEYNQWLLGTFEGFQESHQDIETIYIGTIEEKVYTYPEKSLPQRKFKTLLQVFKVVVSKRLK